MSAPLSCVSNLLLWRIRVATREVRIVPLIKRHRELGIVAVHRSLGIRTDRIDRIHGAVVRRAGQPAQIAQPMSGREQPKRPLAEQEVLTCGRRSRIRQRSEREAAVIRRIGAERDRKSTRLNSSHGYISYAVFCL